MSKVENIERNNMNYWERRLWEKDHTEGMDLERIAQVIDHRDYLATHIKHKTYT